MLKVEALTQCTGHTKEKIETDIRRPKYFSANEAVEYGLIDKVPPVKRLTAFVIRLSGTCVGI